MRETFERGLERDPADCIEDHASAETTRRLAQAFREMFVGQHEVIDRPFGGRSWKRRGHVGADDRRSSAPTGELTYCRADPTADADDRHAFAGLQRRIL